MKKIIVATCVIGLMLVFSGLPLNAITSGYTSESSIPQKLNDCHIDITVHDVWNLLNKTGNGIQIPIDVRFKYEWNEGFIDTPYPEHPRWYSLSMLKTEDGLQAFMDMYAGEDVILYCKAGSRSLEGSQILCDAGFIGTVYNMLGGINAWKAGGYPIRTNTEPDAPDINGSLQGGPGEELTYNFSTTDAEADGVYFWIDWNDSTTPEWTGPFAHDEEITLTHTWEEEGTYLIKAKAKDIFDEESELAELVVSIVENQPPTAPTIDGPLGGKPGIEYEYTFISTDLDGDPVMYSIDWGDYNTEWTEFVDSSEEITLKHIWIEEGEYTIKAKAKDIHDAESNWSEFEVTIPRHRLRFYLWYEWFLERFPLLERLFGIN